MKRLVFLIAVLFAAAAPDVKAQVSPISGLGSIQLLDNTGAPATSGCFYFYAAGTTTQQATFTDSTGGTQNTNPLCLGTGARIGNGSGIWLTTSLFYKIVACLNNDGPFCSAGDILWLQDNIPGGASGGGGSASCASGCTGFFVSGTASPSTTGTLRLASNDSGPCWRNQAGSANLCWSKDSNDLVSFAGGSLKFPEVGAPSPVVGFDILTANNTLHRWQQGNNGAALDTVVGAATVDTFTNKTFDAQGSGNNFKIGGVSISNTGQSSTTFLRGDGTWVAPLETVGPFDLTAQGANCATQTFTTPSANGYYLFSVYEVITQAATTSSTTPSVTINYTDADSSVVQHVNAITGITSNIVGVVAGPLGNTAGISAKNAVAITVSCSGYASSGATPMQYALHGRLAGPF